MILSSAESNFISDALNAPPVVNHLTNWGIWPWAGMIILLLVLATLAIFIAALIPEHSSPTTAVFGNFMFGFYAAALYPLMRHIPWSTLVIVLAAILTIAMCYALASFDAGNFVSYAAVVIANFAPALIDTVIARNLAAIPMSWSMLGLLLGLGAIIAIAGLFRR